MVRSHRPILPDSWYFITGVTNERRTWLAEPSLARILVDQWHHYERAYKFQVDAYSVMQDHYHVVLYVGLEKTISQILHAIHSYVVTLVSKELGSETKVRLWQDRPWDEVIRNERMYWQKVAYTLLNPWRKGLVADPLDPYPFSDIARWKEEHGEEFLRDLFSEHARLSE